MVRRKRRARRMTAAVACGFCRWNINKGPSFARNHAIAHSTAPLIAILDADDFFLDGRFDWLLAEDDWDFVADNIVFIDGRGEEDRTDVPQFRGSAPRSSIFMVLSKATSRGVGASRGEIGFLKPVMRRSFLDSSWVRYKEELRLGEDYDLYARALVNGARYKIVHRCGYGAVVRQDSLSGRHRTVRPEASIRGRPGDPRRSRTCRRRRGRCSAGTNAMFAGVMNCAGSSTSKAETGLATAGLHALKRTRWRSRRSPQAWRRTSSIRSGASRAEYRTKLRRFATCFRPGRSFRNNRGVSPSRTSRKRSLRPASAPSGLRLRRCLACLAQGQRGRCASTCLATWRSATGEGRFASSRGSRRSCAC